jgi:hypothetical protein
LAFVNRFEATRDATEVLDPGHDRLIRDPDDARCTDGAKHVLDVEATAQARPKLEPVESKARPRRRDLEVGGAIAAELKRRFPEPAELVGQPAAVLVADVDRGRGPRPVHVWLDEEAALRIEVVLHRPVKVEVILREIGEHERAEANTEQALERGPVGGRLHRAAPVTRVQHLAEGALQIHGLRGRAGRGTPLAADPVLDRPEEAGPPPSRSEDGEEQERRGGLAIRSRDPEHLELARRVLEEGIGRECHGFPRVGDDELRNGQVEGALDDEGRGAVADGLGSVVVPVGLQAADADEERSGQRSARVVGEVADRDRGRVDGPLGVDGLAQTLELDGAGV